jgi:predicted RND superfamily exporter protein
LEASFAELNINNSVSMLQGTFLGFLLIGVILCLTLRSIKLGLLSVLSNMLPAVAGFGVWALKDGQVGLAVSVVIVITLGVVVDDTIHLLTKYRRTLQAGSSPIEAAKNAINTTGQALITTTLVLCICFGVLAFSHFKPNADLGFLSATTLALALIIDIFLLLPLVAAIDTKFSTKK